MTRSMLRVIPRKGWLDHALASGPELALAILAFVMMPRYFVLSLPGIAHTEQPGWVYFPVMTVASVMAFVGAAAWVIGWALENARGIPLAARWDQFGASLQCLAWVAGGLLFMATDQGSWSSGFQAVIIGLSWLARYGATGRLVKRAQKVETVMQRADALLADTDTQTVIRRDGGRP